MFENDKFLVDELRKRYDNFLRIINSSVWSFLVFDNVLNIVVFCVNVFCVKFELKVWIIFKIGGGLI